MTSHSTLGGFSGPEPITAIFASFDSRAELIYLLLTRLGGSCARGCIAYQHRRYRSAGRIQRMLTAVTVDEVRIGREAAELLDRMRRGELPIETD